MPDPRPAPDRPALNTGDAATIGDSTYALTPDRAGVIKRQVGVIEKSFQISGLLAHRARLLAELEETEAMIAKHAELSK